MAIEYGVPVSKWLEMHSSREITELMAFYEVEEESRKEAELKAKVQNSSKKR